MIRRAIFLLFFAIYTTPLLASERIALIIGNDQYHGWPSLSGAVNDAYAMAQRLRLMDFALVDDKVWVNLDLAGLQAAHKALLAKAHDAHIVLIFFAGHGSGEQNNNWLVPVDAQTIAYREDLPNRALSLQDLLRNLPRQALKIIILDACRDFGLPSRRGLNEALTGFLWVDLPPNTILALSASLGRVAYEREGHGDYTKILLEVLDAELQQPSRSILSILNKASRDLQDRTRLLQRPEVYFSALEERWTKDRLVMHHSRYSSSRGFRLVPPIKPPVSPMPGLCPTLELESFRDCEMGCPTLQRLPDWNFPVGTDHTEYVLAAVDFTPERERYFARLAISKTPITYAQWSVCAQEGACRRLRFADAWAQHPVTRVNYTDVERYLDWLTQRTGQNYRLPTEEEWEYAARGGQHRELLYWQSLRGASSCSFAHTRECNTQAYASVPVAQREPNCFGLHDMLGNVWEWIDACPSHTSKTADNCIQNIVRGGGWDTPLSALRITRQAIVAPHRRLDMIGFRVIRDIMPQQDPNDA